MPLTINRDSFYQVPVQVALYEFEVIISRNNTPPASHLNSALRGVTCFWGAVI